MMSDSVAAELEEIESTAGNLRQKVHADIQALSALFHSQMSVYEDQAKSMCRGIGNVAQKYEKRRFALTTSVLNFLPKAERWLQHKQSARR